MSELADKACLGLSHWRVLTFAKMLLTALAVPPLTLAQVDATSTPQFRELLHAIDQEKRSLLIERYGYELAIFEYFAKPGTLDFYEFDLGALETEGEIITISAKNIAQIKVVSHGISVNWLNGGHFARWRGEIQIPDTNTNVPVKMSLVIRSIDELGNVQRRDPNREITQQALKQESYVVLEESKRRLNEQIVYGLLNSFVQDPNTKTTMRIGQLGEGADSFGTVVVYEVDDEKTVIPSDDSATNPRPPTRDMIHRSEAFREYEDQMRRRFGMPPRSEP